MKKVILSIILMLALLLSLGSCNKKSEGEVSSSDTETQVPSAQIGTLYDALNELTGKNYGKIQLHITTTTDDMELESEYVLTSSKVTYSVERMNLLPEDGDLSGISPDYKTTLKGGATVENGKITKLDGDAVELPAYDELKGNFDFQENYFKNVKAERGMFSAEVISAKSFLGTDKNLSGVKLTVEYNDSAFERIVITYKTANATVNTEYVFEK